MPKSRVYENDSENRKIPVLLKIHYHKLCKKKLAHDHVQKPDIMQRGARDARCASTSKLPEDAISGKHFEIDSQPYLSCE